MTKFSHFILTRFNIQCFNKTSPSEEWLIDRFKLFDKYCFPSVRNQNNQNFKWLLFFDQDTPKRYKKKIEKYSRWKNFIPCYIKGTDLKLKETISLNIQSSVDYLITTRLDNDDAIARDFIDIVQQQFRKQSFEFINIPNGYTFDNKKLYHRIHKSNSFLSLIERRTDFQTVLCIAHNKASLRGGVYQVDSNPFWFQIFHNQNFRLRHIDKTFYRVPLKQLKDGFTFKISDDFYYENQRMIYIENFGKLMLNLLYKVKRYLKKWF